MSNVQALTRSRRPAGLPVLKSMQVGGTRVAFAEAGIGPTVIMLHSSASSGAQWCSLMAALEGDFHLLAPDLYGYGGSEAWPGHHPLRLADEATIVEALMTRSEAPIHLVGHSYGGAVALAAALRMPERIASLTLIEPVAFHILREREEGLLAEVRDVAQTIMRAVVSGDYRAGMERFVDYWNGAGAWKSLRPERQADLAAQAAKVALDFWATMADDTILSTARRLAVPTLILRGERSPTPTRRIAHMLALAMPRARLQIIPGAGHMAPLTHAALTDAAIIEQLLPGRRMADRRSA